jgi:hypothetical protein
VRRYLIFPGVLALAEAVGLDFYRGPLWLIALFAASGALFLRDAVHGE